MSWSFSYQAQDKDEAHKMLKEKVDASSGHCPKKVATMIGKAIDALPEYDGLVNVMSNGHFQTDGKDVSTLVISVGQQFKPTT